MCERIAESGTEWFLDGTFYKWEWRECFHELDEVRIVYVNDRSKPVSNGMANVNIQSASEESMSSTVSSRSQTPT